HQTTYVVANALISAVLRFSRYTFDGNALPRPQLSDPFGTQLQAESPYGLSLLRAILSGARLTQWLSPCDPEHSRTVGRLPEVCCARTTISKAAGGRNVG